MRRLTAISLLVFAPCLAALDASGQTPQFANFSVAAANIATVHAPILDPGSKLSMFEGRIREATSKAPNFAGSYVVVWWNCGSPCQMGAIVDARTGKVLELPVAASGYEFRKDSRLLIINPQADMNVGAATKYYVLEQGTLRPL